MNSKPIYLAYLFAICNAVIVGLSFLFTKTAIFLSDPWDTLAYRFTISFVVMSIPVLLKQVKFHYKKGKRKIWLLSVGLLYPLSFFTFQAFGLLFASSSEGGILFASVPILTMIMASFFLKEKSNLKQVLAILTSVFGVVFIFIMKGLHIKLGDFIGLIFLFFSCLSLAGYNILVRSVSKEFTTIEITYIMMIFGFIIFNAASLVKHTIDGSLYEYIALVVNFKFMFCIMYLGVFASLLTSLFSNYSLSKIRSSQISVFSNISTVISMIAGAIFLHEPLHIYHWVGALLIIGGILGTHVYATEKVKTQKDSKSITPHNKESI